LGNIVWGETERKAATLTRAKIVLAALLVLVAWLVFSLGFYHLLVVPREYRFDFSYRWIAGRAALGGQDPYAQEVSRAIYTAMFETQPPAGDYLQGFSNPAYHLMLFIPLYYLPYQVAVSLWAGLQIIFLFAAVTIGLYLLAGCELPSPAMLVAFLLYCTWFRHTMVGLTFAQFIIFQVLLSLLAVLALAHGRDAWAGVALALTTNHPALSLVLVVAVLGWALLARRWKVLAGFSIGMGALLAGSAAWLGWWAPGFLESTRNYTGMVPWLLAHGSAGLRGWVALSSLLLIGLAWLALRRPETDVRRDAAALIAGVGLFSVPQTNSYNFTFLLVLVLIGWTNLKNRWLRLAWLAGWWLLPWVNWGTNELMLKANLWIIYIVTLIWGSVVVFKLWQRRPFMFGTPG
jgi:hypothetical protein